MSATALAKEVCVPQATLSRWLRLAGTFEGMSESDRTADPRPARELTVEDRVRILTEVADATSEDVGALLRRHGLTTGDLDAWKAALGGVGKRPRKPRKTDAEVAEARRVRALERELARKDKALAEAAAIIVLQKKVHEIWGDEDDDTPPRNGR
jgi:hypothetical protein